MQIVPSGIVALWLLGGVAVPTHALQDVGIFPELNAGVRIALPPRLSSRPVRLRVDDKRQILVVYDGGLAVKAYPVARAVPAGALAATVLLNHLRVEDGAE